ncbi:MAG: InlB B-repeat-containing protein [Treponema sp.]|jgi:uncharacterized repeat protein (TIGR02543 family)|nr:InlB B-repeat-containing protein [Treponema sp.]
MVKRILLIYGFAAAMIALLSGCDIPDPYAEMHRQLHKTVTFMSNGSIVSKQTVFYGNTVNEPANPKRAGYDFEGWHRDNNTFSDKWKFATGVTENITLYAQWTPAKAGLYLKKNSAYILINSVSPNNVNEAVNHVNANAGAGEYLLLIDEDIVGTLSQTLGANARLSIGGLGNERTISFSNNGVLFKVSGNNASLSLRNNITLKGFGYVGAIGVFVSGGTFTMQSGAQITNFSSNGVKVGNPSEGTTGTFTMTGGIISGNEGNGVFVDNGRFTMSGGSITNNNVTYEDALKTDARIHERSTFTLSGNATIGTLTLYADAYDNAAVSIRSDWTGSVVKLNLAGNDSGINDVNDVIGFWENTPVITGNGLNDANIKKFPLGWFHTTGFATQLISDTHYIDLVDDEGILRKSPTGAGAGTADAPFLIFAEADLRGVGKGINGWSLSAHYEMVNDITLAGNWTSIGSSDTSFTGIFDGNGKTISNLAISASTDYNGMFGSIGASGVVKNLGLINCDIRGRSYLGGVAGDNAGTVQNCYVTGTVRSNGGTAPVRIGGVAGNNTGTVQNCYSTATVSGYNDAGGVVGYNTSSGMVQNCYATGNVTITSNSDSSYVGGVVGRAQGTGTVRNCVALNPNITTNSANNNNSGRVLFFNGATVSNNYARSDMQRNNINAAWVSSHTGKDGAGITAVQFNSQNWWTNADNWNTTSPAAAWDFFNVWEWDTSGTPPRNLPKLKNVGGQ